MYFTVTENLSNKTWYISIVMKLDTYEEKGEQLRRIHSDMSTKVVSQIMELITNNKKTSRNISFDNKLTSKITNPFVSVINQRDNAKHENFNGAYENLTINKYSAVRPVALPGKGESLLLPCNTHCSSSIKSTQIR